MIPHTDIPYDHTSAVFGQGGRYDFEVLEKSPIDETDRKTIAADGNDLAFVTVSLRDANGTLIPDADNQLTFEVSGAGAFKAACNGDATSLEPFTQPTMRLFHGQLVVVLQSANYMGDIRLVVRDSKNKAFMAEALVSVK